MRTTFGPSKLIVHGEDSIAGELDVYRIVRSELPADPAFINSLRSHYELHEPPRKVERKAAVIHMGISVYRDRRVAHETAARFGKLGDFVAHLRIRPGFGANWAPTGHPLHLTMWADPFKLLNAVVDIERVDR